MYILKITFQLEKQDNPINRQKGLKISTDQHQTTDWQMIDT